LDDLGVYERIILKWILRKQRMRMGIDKDGVQWLYFFGHGKEISDSIKGRIPCQNDMARPQVADGGDGLHVE
jgi:hypothetical protein